MDRKLKIYVGCSLTYATKEFMEDVANLKAKLLKKYEIMEFIGLVAGTSTDVYRWDIHECVGKCDLLVAICDSPSIGLGYELGVAVEKHGKPVLAVAHEDSKVTRLVLGIDHPNFTFKRFNVLDEVLGFIEEKINSVNEFGNMNQLELVYA